MAKRTTVKPPHTPKPRHGKHSLRALEKLIMAVSQTVTDALDAQDRKIADLSQKVDDFVASHSGSNPADDQAIVDRLVKQGASVDAIAAKLA